MCIDFFENLKMDNSHKNVNGKKTKDGKYLGEVEHVLVEEDSGSLIVKDLNKMLLFEKGY